jgi:hypothetical protein
MRNLWKYYPDNKSTCTNIVLCGFGVSAIIFNKISNFIINPDQVKIEKITHLYPDYVGLRVPKYFLIVSIVIILFGLFSSLFIFDFEEEEGKKDMDINKEKDIELEKEKENLILFENNLTINLTVN